MPDLDVATDPVLVYGMVALFVGAVVLAMIFVRPRRGLGEAGPSDPIGTRPVAGPRASRGPWMPGGDVFGREPETDPEPPPAAAETWPLADPWQSGPPAPGAEPAGHDPWLTGTTDQSGPQPRWDKG
ncbi:MAG TPA: hypothetical protein VM284_02285 [Candidatus Limnocylindria bacterium]|nr:hypothetical protein [Candidatus Limnocylindria bacterium]